MKPIRADIIDDLVWDWLKDTIQHPENIAAGLRAQQKELNARYAALRERAELTLHRLSDIETQLEKLLDLYLGGDFPKDVLSQRKNEMEKLRGDLSQEYNNLARQLETNDLSDDHVAQIEDFCAEIREGLDNATLEDKRRYLELMNVQGTLVKEDGERVIYIQCRLGKQRLVLSATLPSSNIGAKKTVPSIFRQMALFQ